MNHALNAGKEKNKDKKVKKHGGRDRREKSESKRWDDPEDDEGEDADKSVEATTHYDVSDNELQSQIFWYEVASMTRSREYILIIFDIYVNRCRWDDDSKIKPSLEIVMPMLSGIVRSNSHECGVGVYDNEQQAHVWNGEDQYFGPIICRES